MIADIAVNPNNDEEILVVVSNYNTTNIYWTNNAKSASPTWKVAEGNLTTPSIRSCMIVVKKNATNASVTEYYVGTSIGLYSAVNIGTGLQNNTQPTWVREGGNVLNYSVISSMDYRPQDNVLLIGTHGNGMYFADIGSPDFRPNQNTGVDDPIRNDKNFINRAYPTLVKDRMDYQVGNMFSVKQVAIGITSVNGQLVFRKDAKYESGFIDTRRLSKGLYILTITSKDNKQQFVQKFVKD